MAETANISGGWNPSGGHARVFSGHESFACRYGWLPKLYEAVQRDEELFTSDERAILTLGLGKNMVKAVRFWGQVFGLLQVQRGLASNTELARRLLDTDAGIDPYLEDPGSLWRLHWIVTAHAGLGAWVTTFPRVAGRADHARSADRCRPQSGRRGKGICDAENGHNPRGHLAADL